jgi:hypothetical protein
MPFASDTPLGPYKIVALIGSGKWAKSIVLTTRACAATLR